MYYTTLHKKENQNWPLKLKSKAAMAAILNFVKMLKVASLAVKLI